MNTYIETPRDRIFRAYWQDGSIDLFAGIGLALIGIGWLADLIAISAVFPAILVPLWVAFRSKLVEPRLGHIRFDQPRRSQLRRVHTGLLIAGCVMLLLGIAVYLKFRGPLAVDQWLRAVVPALPAVLVGFGGVLTGFLMGLHRFARYGIACIAAGLIVALLQVDPGWSLLAGGCVALISGALLLRAFFRDFPLLPGELE